MNNESSGMGVIVGVIIVLIVLVVGFIAYKQGIFTGQKDDTKSIDIKVGGYTPPATN